jgi:hypothetical protein
MPGGRFSVALVICLVVYLGGAVGIVFALKNARTDAIESLSTPEEQARWQKWKADAAQQGGPVARRPPKSDEPPTLVLLRDHFGVLVVASLVFYTFLFALAVFLGQGMMRGS